VAPRMSSRDTGEIYRPALVKGRYRITDVIHRGRRGDVLAAYDNREARRVVLKRIPDPSRSETTRLRTAHRTLAGLNHPNVGRTLELIEGRTDAWLVSEEVDGRPLNEWWATLPLGSNASPIDRWRHAAPIAAALLDGVEAMHKRQLAHLDIKPANIIVDTPGRAVIVGIGTGAPPDELDARSQAEIRERDGYLAPEILDGLSTSRLADQWSVGAVIYELLSGQKAVPGETPAEVAKSYGVGRVQPIREWQPSTNPDLERVILRMLSWDPEDRYATIAAARSALGSHLTRSIDAPRQLWAVAPPPVVGMDSLDAFFHRRLLELKAGRGSVIRVVDDVGSGKTTLLKRWAQAAVDAQATAIVASCLPTWPRTALDSWFRPPPVDPRSPPPPDLVDQALAALPTPSVVLLDTLEEVDTLVWARVQRAAAAATRGTAPVLLVLAGRALATLDPWVEEGDARLFNVTMPRLKAADVANLMRAESDDPEDQQLLELVAETHAADAKGLPGRIVNTLLMEEGSQQMRRDGRLWIPIVGSADFDRPPPPMPVTWPQINGYMRELGDWVEVEMLLGVLPLARQLLLDALQWAAEEGAVEFREAAGHWLLRPTARAAVGGNVDLHALQATHGRAARWLQNNGEFTGLAAERTAHHWSQAGEPGRAADAYIRAAKAHAGIGSSSEARRLAQLSRSFDARRSGTTHPGTNPMGRAPR